MPKKLNILVFYCEINHLQDSQIMETPTCSPKQFFALNSAVISKFRISGWITRYGESA